MTDTERILKLRLIISKGFPANSLECDLWLKFGRAIDKDEFDELEQYISHCVGK